MYNFFRSTPLTNAGNGLCGLDLQDQTITSNKSLQKKCVKHKPSLSDRKRIYYVKQNGSNVTVDLKIPTHRKNIHETKKVNKTQKREKNVNRKTRKITAFVIQL